MSTISQENKLFVINNKIRLDFAVDRRLDANELNELFEKDESLRREYLDFYAESFENLS